MYVLSLFTLWELPLSRGIEIPAVLSGDMQEEIESICGDKHRQFFFL